jgi:hypothetical protein
MISRFSVAIPSPIADRLHQHLARADGQEDCCFLLWHSSTAATRTTGLIAEVVLPQPGERIVKGTVSFTSGYFLRAASLAAEQGSGLAFIHSHPAGGGWQDLNEIDAAAETSLAAQTLAITGRPLIGLTYAAGDAGYGARVWQRHGHRLYEPTEAENIRVVGAGFQVTWNDRLVPTPRSTASQVRSISAWGPRIHADMTRLRVGVIGLGSLGMPIAEALARTGFTRLSLFDFDQVEDVNLDRLPAATKRDVRLARTKLELAARLVRRSSTADRVDVRLFDLSVAEPAGMAAAADCDVVFSCVDRPWPRAVLNLLGYAHLIPVVDGGILIDARGGRLRGAEWRAHIAAPIRACLECLGQYEASLVAAERDGSLDDPQYIKSLPTDHPLRRGENVFAFSAAAAAAELLQFLTMLTRPSGVSDVGAQLFHLTTGTVDRREEGCAPSCIYASTLLAAGDDSGLTATGRHVRAEIARAKAKSARRRPVTRLGRLFDDLLWRLH